MNIQKKKTDKTMEVLLSGRLDTVSSSQLENSLVGEIDDLTTLIFDFADLDYISSAGLRVLLIAKKHLGSHGTLIIKNANDTIMEVFSITGFDSILTIQ